MGQDWLDGSLTGTNSLKIPLTILLDQDRSTRDTLDVILSQPTRERNKLRKNSAISLTLKMLVARLLSSMPNATMIFERVELVQKRLTRRQILNEAELFEKRLRSREQFNLR